MKEIKIKQLTLNNFKGIQNLTVNFSDDTVISGDNGTGKTTVFDAFLWLLFGKDSQGKSDFAIKTLTPAGEEIPQIEHSVKGTLTVNGIKINLERTYKEIWTKKRGQAAASFTGHETIYSVDNVPITAAEYKKKINDIIPEDTFRLLTSPSYFGGLKWDKRREILMTLCGEISNEDVIKDNPALSEVPEILGQYSVEDKRKIISASKKKLNDRMQELPARIDELRNTVIATDNTEEELKAAISKMEITLKEAETRNTAAVIFAEKRRKAEQYRIDRELEDRRNFDRFNQEKSKIQWEIERATGENSYILNEISKLKSKLKELAENYTKEKSRKVTFDEICPCCGQILPADKIQEARENANAMKANKLRQIGEEGQKTKDRMTAFQNELAGKDEALQKLNKSLEKYNLPPARWNPDTDKTYQDLLFDCLQQDGNDNSEEINKLKNSLCGLRSELAKIQAAADVQKRIYNLSEELKSAQKEYEELERQLYTLEQYTIEKVNLLENNINSMFKLAKFKLFETQINGGINECCTILYNGVPFGAGLNRAAETNVGLDIINTLSRKYNINAPVWVDNAEAITQLYKLNTQTIRLVVKENIKMLEVA